MQKVFRYISARFPLFGIIAIAVIVIWFLLTALIPTFNVTTIAQEKAGPLLYDNIKRNFIAVTPSVTPTPKIVTVTVPVTVQVTVPVYIQVPSQQSGSGSSGNFPAAPVQDGGDD